MMRTVLAVLMMGAMPLPAQQFVTAIPVVPGSPGPTPTSGYLKVSMTSQLGPLAGISLPRPWYAWRSPKLELVAVTLNVNPGLSAATDVPVAVYDVKTQQESRSAAVQLGQVQFVSFANGAPQPALTFKMHAVTEDLAAQFRNGLQAVEGIVTAAPFATLLPGATQLTTATKVLTSFLLPGEQANPQWVSETKVGLGPGPLAVVPLDGTVSVVFLKPAQSDASIPAFSIIERCTSSPTEICTRNDHRPYTELPYLLLSAEVLDYRDPTTLGARALTCSSSADDVKRYAEVLHNAQLTAPQRSLEDKLLDRMDLLLLIRADVLNTDNGAADLANRWAHRNDDTGSLALWPVRGAPQAAATDACINAEVVRRGVEQQRRWTLYRDAFERAANWATVPDAADRIGQLEGFLKVITGPIVAFNLTTGAPRAMLRDEQAKIEALIVPSDLALVQTATATPDLIGLRAQRGILEARRSTTNCERCRDVLAVAIGQTDVRIASLNNATSAQVAAVVDVAGEKSVLANVQQAARQVAAVAEVVAPTGDAAGLRQQASRAEVMLKDSKVTAAAVRALSAEIKQSVDSTRGTVQKP